MAESEDNQSGTKPTQANSPEGSPDAVFGQLLQNLDQYMPGQNMETITKAYHKAAQYHEHQKRRSGEPYITHPLEVANIVTTLRLDQASVVAAILHDVVEDTSCTLEEIEELFGAEVTRLVDGLTKISKIKFRSNQEKLAENFRKMILAMAKDLRVILIKLCDRLHNMRTIGSLPIDKSRRIAQETLDIYAPLANRLGIYGIKSELEDLCLRSLRNDIYRELRTKIAAKKSERQKYITEVKTILENELKKYGFTNISVYGRPKHFFSIYKKMVERHLDFEDIHDLFAFRIIVSSIKDCYEALGVVHAMWKPMPGRFKDYIAMPKANMYQSLHTTVVRPNGEPAEIQIRTEEMHRTCEYGVAAHWAYKEMDSKGKLDNTDLQKFSWLRQIIQWQSELKDPDEFLEAVKVDLFDEEIFVFTPKGDVLSLPKNATALDFAFTVHTDVGLHTIGAKVNGRIAPIKRKLKSGDIVEILTSPNQKPSKDWLSFVATSKARNKIRSHLRSEQREKSRKLGKELLAHELESHELSYDDLVKSQEISKLTKVAKESQIEDVLVGIGYGRINAKDLVEKTFPSKEKKDFEKEILESEIETKKPSVKKSPKQGVLVSGHSDVLVQFARCCTPLPGEDIVGYITRGRGVTVHRSSCPRAFDQDPARRISVEWSPSAQSESTFHKCSISIITQDKPGVLAEVTSVLSSCGANVAKAEARVSQVREGILDFELGIKNAQHLENVITKLEAIPSVLSVKRMNLLKQRRVRKIMRRGKR